ncbi:TetR/AcrR family transcriptional regulator [Neobacillus notoginsengisoli]|uniref:TetR/AcrR family transcriptional regulator n=1 Tax=Neobacillus notoginsengisoli TaxID=1578198 RepID=A0A417YL38_9BACI|nr:TetR/AcrR family transcriptional regulator [Neobacillus notoginsengisoli]RHW33939.1 TetR/AcrR family transcriptional regulator [Neobacillus notoginsengisoli]
MTETQTDPRVLRTRKLIMEAFIDLSGKKEFKDITINDITAEATVNRATFYNHFADKYELLEKVLSEVLLVNFDSQVLSQNELNEEVITSIFTSITNFQCSLSRRCHRGYEDTIGKIIMNHLEIIFLKMFLKQHPDGDEEALRIGALMLSWGIYGASLDWQNKRDITPEEYIKMALPFIQSGTDFIS